MELILKYFPDLTEEQKRQFAALYDLYTDWNSKINVISRKDIENLYEHHVLHSGHSQGNPLQAGYESHGLRHGGRLPGHPAGDTLSRSAVSPGGQHRQESARGHRDSRQHRTEKRNHPPRTRRRGKATVRLRGEPVP